MLERNADAGEGATCWGGLVAVGGGSTSRSWLAHGAGLSRALSSRYARAMSKLLRGLAAGWGAKKMGGGCLSTIIIFIVLWYLLGHFDIFR